MSHRLAAFYPLSRLMLETVQSATLTLVPTMPSGSVVGIFTAAKTSLVRQKTPMPNTSLSNAQLSTVNVPTFSRSKSSRTDFLQQTSRPSQSYPLIPTSAPTPESTHSAHIPTARLSFVPSVRPMTTSPRKPLPVPAVYPRSVHPARASIPA